MSRSNAQAPERAAPGLRLSYLDGLRGLAALYVVMFHAVLGFGADLSGGWRLLRLSLAFGHEAVAIFIVLSGYCLMLPVARSADGRLTSGFWPYLARRAFRILPPYFVALAGSLVLIQSVACLREPATGTIWDESLPGLALGPILSHLLLVHNWVPTWAFQINGPLWSVASEWQIYFFFPLLLLPLSRRYGLLSSLGVAAMVGYAPLLLVPERAMTAVPWYLTLFALGMLAAGIGFSGGPLEQRLRHRVNWSRVSAALWLGCVLFGTAGASIWFRMKPLTDLLLGCAAAALLVHCTEQVQQAAQTGSRRALLLRLLASRVAVAIGHFSYSLYLTHLPVVALCFFALRSLSLSGPALALALLATSLPCSLLVAYAFHLAVERLFLGRPPSLRSLRSLLRLSAPH